MPPTWDVPAIAVTVTAAVSIGMLALHAYFLSYMDRLQGEGCTCAQGWQRRFIEAALVVFILVALLQFAMALTGTALSRSLRHIGIFSLLQGVMLALMVAYVVVTHDFIVGVRRQECGCARGTAFDVLNIANICYIVLLVIYGVFQAIYVVRALGRQPGGASAQPAPPPPSPPSSQPPRRR